MFPSLVPSRFFPSKSLNFKLIQNLVFGFSVEHNITVSKILETQSTLIRRCNCYQSPLFVAFNIPDIHFSPLVLFIELTFRYILSSVRVYFVERSNKTPFALHRLRRHCMLVLCPTDKIYLNLRIFSTPCNLPKIRAEDSRHKDNTWQEVTGKNFPYTEKKKTGKFKFNSFYNWVAN